LWITSNLNNAKISFDYPQVIRLGLKYDATANMTLFADFDWEDWSQFSENTLNVDGTGPITIVETIDRNWKDTYHVGLGMFYELGENHHLSAGVAYDTSPVDDKDYAKAGRGNWRHAISASAMWFGDGEVDQIAQGARFKGEFDTNWIFIIGANLQYRF
jgi:long-chain fatty acid transport protein